MTVSEASGPDLEPNAQLLSVTAYDEPPDPLRSFLAQFMGSVVLSLVGFGFASINISQDLQAITLTWVTLPGEEAYLWLAAAAAMVIALGASAPALRQPFILEGKYDKKTAEIFQDASLKYQIALRRVARLGARCGAVLGMFVGYAGAADYWTEGDNRGYVMRGCLVLMLAILLTFTASVLVGALKSGLGNLGPWYPSLDRRSVEAGLDRFYWRHMLDKTALEPPRRANIFYYAVVIILLSLVGGLVLLVGVAVTVRATAPADTGTTVWIAFISVMYGAPSVLAASAAAAFWAIYNHCRDHDGQGKLAYCWAAAFCLIGAVALLYLAAVIFPKWWMIFVIVLWPSLWMLTTYKWPKAGSAAGIRSAIAYLILVTYRESRTRTAPLAPAQENVDRPAEEVMTESSAVRSTTGSSC